MTASVSRASDPVRFSLVIPAFNEAGYLPRLLDSVAAARARCPGGPAALEVVVTDDASTDGTGTIAAAHGCRVVAGPRRSIAAARNAGAAAATGELLCFTDADGRLHPDTFAAIDRALRSPRVIAGATGMTLERWSGGLGATYAIFALLAWLTRFDSGVVFCRRADFGAVGGYDERRAYGEDVDFLWRLRRHGRRTGRRRLVRPRGAKTIASTRKFDRHGDWHYFARMPRLAWRMLFRHSAPTEFGLRYWYHPDR